jgi:hypothetical protein
MRSILMLMAAKLFLSIKTFLPTMAATFLPNLAAQGREYILRASLDLTSAQILALETTALPIVPAPGVGFRIVPLLSVIRFFGGSVAYTDAGGAVQLTAGSAVYALTDNNIFLVTVSPNRRTESMGFAEVLDTAANPPTSDNAPLNIQKITNNFAAGNGTARVSVLYCIEPTT